MSVTVIVGAQWGDEGKGKVIDILAGRSDVVVRAQGGNNAGHTVVAGGKTYKLHLVPSGVFYPGTLNLVGAGVVLDPLHFVAELDGLASQGVDTAGIRIDPRAHVVMPYHRALDTLLEDELGAGDIGTTRRGIGPCYSDKAARIGLRVCDLCEPALFYEKAAPVIQAKNRLITEIYGGQALDVSSVIEGYTAAGERLRPLLADTSALAYEAAKAGRRVLFEGAQGMLLDIDYGTYPFVTSSHPTSGGACVGGGIGPTLITDCVGVAKAYTTRVGKGPFPTELTGAVGDAIRESGGEYGTTTGRPRRCGWLDTVSLRYSVRVNGLTALALNKLDTLSGHGTLRICDAYELDGRVVTDFPPSLEQLARCVPVYTDYEGFGGDLSRCAAYDELPPAARAYVEAAERAAGCPVTMVGVGPGREQMLYRKPLL